MIVLDATLPGQRLGLRFDAKDTKFRLNAGTALGPLAEVGDRYLMLGQAPSSGQILLGTEVTLMRVEPFPDGSGDVEWSFEVSAARAHRRTTVQRERHRHGARSSVPSSRQCARLERLSPAALLASPPIHLTRLFLLRACIHVATFRRLK